MKSNSFMNQKGGMTALLSVIVFSSIIMMSITATYTYLQNQTRYQSFVKANYEVGFVMQDMGQAVLQAYQQAAACPAGTTLKYLDCAQVCMPLAGSYLVDSSVVPPAPNGNTLPADVTAGMNAICVTSNSLNRTLNNASLFCAYNAPTAAGGNNGLAQPGYCALINTTDNFKASEKIAGFHRNKLESWYGRLDKFFDTTARKVPKANQALADMMAAPMVQPPTMWGWLIPEKTYADTVGQTQTTQTHGSNTNIAMGALNCGTAGAMSTSSSCQRCGKTERLNGQCMDVAICPPWVSAASCALDMAQGKPDPRYHQVITLNQ